MSRLLIIGCSQKKRPDPELLPAIDRYDGPAFRVLRRYLRERKPREILILILSAEFGLIPLQKRIPNYDQRMTANRADDLRPSVCDVLNSAIMRHNPSEIFICAGKRYLRALYRLPNAAPRLMFATGGQCGKLASLKAWLREGES